MSGDEEAQRRVAELLSAGSIGDEALREAARVLKPIPVADPATGRPHSWFVPVAIDDMLAGFAELQPDLELVRYSSFQRHSADTTDLPDVSDWTDPGTIRQRAARISRRDETLGEPILTYDRAPTRIAWGVRATDSKGRARTLYVVGDYAYEQPAESDEPEVGGEPSA